MISAREALKILLDGNERFIKGIQEHPNRCHNRRQELTESQNPFAVIFTCSDSRVSPSIIFDHGLGDMFIIRVAGQVISKEILGTIEYAVENLNVKLIMVLGHDNCGAIQAAITDNYDHESENTMALINAIKPSIADAHKVATNEKELLDLAIKYNVLHTVKALNNSKPVLAKFAEEGKITIVGAIYKLDSGKVELID